MKRKKKVVVCPGCKFPNIVGAAVCLTCKEPLEGVAATDEAPSDEAGVGEETTKTHRIDRIDSTEPRGRRRPAPVPQPQQSSGGEAWLDQSWEHNEIVGWLHCEPLPPIALGPKRIVSMGRGKDCDLILPHPTVSRVHGTVRVLGRQLVYEDCSSYGSLLNGRQIKSAELKVGDVLGLGPYEISVIAPDDASGEDELDEDSTRPLDLAALRSAELMGSLDRVSLMEIVQGLEFNKKTGTLRVVARDHGAVAVREGVPVRATYGDLAGEDAIVAMLQLSRGSFSFTGEAVSGERTVRQALTPLLLEASRQLDERLGRDG